MKKIGIILLMVSLSLLIACGEGGSEVDNDDTMTSDQSNDDTPTNDEVDTTVEVATNEEETNHSSDEEDISSDEKDPAPVDDAKQILKQSAEVMSELTSYKMVNTFVDDSTINGESQQTNKSFIMEVVLSDPLEVHGELTMNNDAEGFVEMYMKDGVYYEGSEEHWFSKPADAEDGNMYETYKMLEEGQMEAYVEHSDLFEVTDHDTYYTLSFVGTMEEYQNIVLGSLFEKVNETFQEHGEKMEVSKGSYEIIIEKENFHLRQFKMDYNAKATDGSDQMEQQYNGTSRLFDHNLYDLISVPEEVIEQAKPL